MRLNHKREEAILDRIKRGYDNRGIAEKTLQEPKIGTFEPFEIADVCPYLLLYQ